jgi:hypothetical protein
MITDNEIASAMDDITGIRTLGDGATISGNTLSGATISVAGDDTSISGNTIDGGGIDRNLIEVSGGSPVTVTDNDLSDTQQTALVITESALATDITVTKNTLTNVRYGIQILDFPDRPMPAPAPISGLFGGSLGNANVFIDSGSASGQSGRLFTITFGTEDYNAEFNNWGLCTLAAIESEVLHGADNPSLGTVDFDPFIDPGGCPSATATPSPTPSPSPTASATSTASPTPSGQTPSPTEEGTPSTTATPTATVTVSAGPGTETVWGNANCSGPDRKDPPDPVDSLLTLRADAGLSANTGDCPGMGEEVDVLNASLHLWGDVDCSGAVNPVDSLKVLRFDAGLSVSQEEGCPLIGSEVQIVAG